MEFEALIRRRRMVRAFSDRPVGRDQVERVLSVAQRAPSAGFTQGVFYVAVADPDLRRRVADAAGEGWYTAKGHAPFISSAPVQVVLCTSEEAYLRRYREPDKRKPEVLAPRWAVPYWYLDGGASLMLLLLAAVDQGLAAAFVGVRDPDQLRTILGIPADVLPLGIVLLGHPAPDQQSTSLRRGRKPLAELLHWDGWGDAPNGGIGLDRQPPAQG